MNRKCGLQVALGVIGAVFVAAVYPLVLFMREAPGLSMMFSLYVTLGVFLLVAIRNPSGNRSLIAFTSWSSFAHAALMTFQAFRGMISQGELAGVALLAVIGITLVALAPTRLPAEK